MKTNKTKPFWIDEKTVTFDKLSDCEPESSAFIQVIELEPMLKVMETMAEAISNWKIQVETYGGDYLPGNYKQLITALESYKAVKRENGLE